MCTGNICRSPFIERLLQLELDHGTDGTDGTDGLPGRGGISVSSAGTSALVGLPMDEQAAAQLVAHGGDPSGFSARELTPALVAGSDLVLTATRAHRGKVALMSPKALRRVFTFRDFAHLLAGMDRLTTAPAGTSPRSRVRQVAEKAAASRGLRPPLEPSLADIVDPYRREDAVFAMMAQQIVESMPVIVRSLIA